MDRRVVLESDPHPRLALPAPGSGEVSQVPARAGRLEISCKKPQLSGFLWVIGTAGNAVLLA